MGQGLSRQLCAGAGVGRMTGFETILWEISALTGSRTGSSPPRKGTTCGLKTPDRLQSTRHGSHPITPVRTSSPDHYLGRVRLNNFLPIPSWAGAAQNSIPHPNVTLLLYPMPSLTE